MQIVPYTSHTVLDLSPQTSQGKTRILQCFANKFVPFLTLCITLDEASNAVAEEVELLFPFRMIDVSRFTAPHCINRSVSRKLPYIHYMIFIRVLKPEIVP